MNAARIVFFFLVGAAIVAAPLLLVRIEYDKPPVPDKPLVKGKITPPEEKLEQERKKREEEEKKRKEEEERRKKTEQAIEDLQKKMEETEKAKTEEMKKLEEKHQKELTDQVQQTQKMIEEMRRELDEARKPRVDPELLKQIEKLQRELDEARQPKQDPEMLRRLADLQKQLDEAKKPDPALLKQLEDLKKELAAAKQPPPAPPPRAPEAAPEFRPVKGGRGATFIYLIFDSVETARKNGIEFAVATSDDFVTHVIELNSSHKVTGFREWSRDDRNQYADISFGFRSSIPGLKDIQSSVDARFNGYSVKMVVDRSKFNKHFMPLLDEARGYALYYKIPFDGVRLKLQDEIGSISWTGVYSQGKFYPKP